MNTIAVHNSSDATNIAGRIWGNRNPSKACHKQHGSDQEGCQCLPTTLQEALLSRKLSNMMGMMRKAATLGLVVCVTQLTSKELVGAAK